MHRLPHRPGFDVFLLVLRYREQGLIVAKGNPQNIQSIDDLPHFRYANRQRGAGTRLLLDFELEQRGISSGNIAGYEHEEYTHLAVAAAVASGIADCGLGVRNAAIALSLDFISVGWERYDLVIPIEHLQHPGIQHLLGLLADDVFRDALGSHPGYDTRETGKTQFTS